MDTYLELKKKYNNGELNHLKAKKDHPRKSIEWSINSYLKSNGSKEGLADLTYATKCAKRCRNQAVSKVIKANIPIEVTPNLFGNYLEVTNNLNYDYVLNLYRNSRDENKTLEKIGIYHYLKVYYEKFGDDVDIEYKRFLDDGVCKEHLMFYNLPKDIKEKIKQPNALQNVIEMYHNKIDNIDFILYDFVRETPNCIEVVQKLINAGVKENDIAFGTLVGVALHKNVRPCKLKVLYDFDMPHLNEIIKYILENYKTFKYKSCMDAVEQMVRAGIDKKIIFS